MKMNVFVLFAACVLGIISIILPNGVNGTLLAIATRRGAYISASANIGGGLMKRKNNFRWIRQLGRRMIVGYEVRESMLSLSWTICSDVSYHFLG
jgi:hypothetical protein